MEFDWLEAVPLKLYKIFSMLWVLSYYLKEKELYRNICKTLGKLEQAVETHTESSDSSVFAQHFSRAFVDKLY